MTSWRDHAAPIIAKVIEDVGYDDIGRLKRAMFDAYPFGERKYQPYKIWCDEVRRQTNGRLSRHGPKPVKKKWQRHVVVDAKTKDIFSEDE
jgi:hypothetical protein